jgi:hypothetical protein
MVRLLLEAGLLIDADLFWETGDSKKNKTLRRTNRIVSYRIVFIVSYRIVVSYDTIEVSKRRTLSLLSIVRAKK